MGLARVEFTAERKKRLDASLIASARGAGKG